MSEEETTKPKRRAAQRPAGPPVEGASEATKPAKADKVEKATDSAEKPAKKSAAKKAPIAIPVFQAAPEVPLSLSAVLSY